jgi:hypothetical protein
MLRDHDGCFIGIWMPPQAQDVFQAEGLECKAMVG